MVTKCLQNLKNVITIKSANLFISIETVFKYLLKSGEKICTHLHIRWKTFLQYAPSSTRYIFSRPFFLFIFLHGWTRHRHRIFRISWPRWPLFCPFQRPTFPGRFSVDLSFVHSETSDSFNTRYNTFYNQTFNTSSLIIQYHLYKYSLWYISILWNQCII